MSAILDRLAALETVTVEPFAGIDTQGASSYGSGVDVDARVVHEDALILAPDGSEERTTLTLYLPAGQGVTPAHQDRLTVDSVTYIVRERAIRTRLDGATDHIRVRAREE